MSSAKVTLSPEEWKLVTDPQVILTKNSVMEKVVALMAGLSEGYRRVWEDAVGRTGLSEGYRRVWEDAVGGAGLFPDGGVGPAAALRRELGPASPKISRGENYRGLPWVMLDYPRYFGREDVFAIRTLFWWGNAFSVTLHLKGRYKELFMPAMRERWVELAAAGFHIGVSADEWRHEHVPDNYQLLKGAEEMEAAGEFLKFSSAVGLHRWEDVPEEMMSMFKTLINVLF